MYQTSYFSNLYLIIQLRILSLSLLYSFVQKTFECLEVEHLSLTLKHYLVSVVSLLVLTTYTAMSKIVMIALLQQVCLVIRYTSNLEISLFYLFDYYLFTVTDFKCVFQTKPVNIPLWQSSYFNFYVWIRPMIKLEIYTHLFLFISVYKELHQGVVHFLDCIEIT